MLIDRGHVRWIVATLAIGGAALGLHAWLASRSPGELTGGSTAGLWYGIVGSGLMIYAGLLSVLRKVPGWWWLGSRKIWLKGHIWLGLLSLVFIMAHSNYHWGSGLEFVLWLVALGVVGTGIFGLILQQFLPQAMAMRVPVEAPFEQLPHLCQVLCRKADALVEATELLFQYQNPAHATGSLAELNTEVLDFHEKVVRPYLSHPGVRSSPLRLPLRAEAMFARLRAKCGLRSNVDPITAAESSIGAIRTTMSQAELKDLTPKADKALNQVQNLLADGETEGLADQTRTAFGDLMQCATKADVFEPVTQLRRLCQDRYLTNLEGLCTERRMYRLQERMYNWLHGWLLIHVPLSVALLVLGVTHAIMALYY